MNVPRETGPPAAALKVFGPDRLPLAEGYVSLLQEGGVQRGLIGPRETDRLWDRHVLNSVVIAEAMPASASVADIGSGAGFPGLPLAIARPDLSVCLIESMQRRVDFLREVVDDLGLDTVEVVRSRAEDLHGTRAFDVVTSRAVAPLPRLASWSMPLARADGSMLAIKGSSAQAEVDGAAAELVRHGCASPEVLRCGAGVVDPQVLLIRVEWSGPSRVSWGARPGSSPSASRRRPRPRPRA